MVHENFEYMPITANVILQLHKKLHSLLLESFGGKFKTTATEIDELKSDDTVVVRFSPLEAYETLQAVDSLCNEYNRIISSVEIDPLVIIPTFIYDFYALTPLTTATEE